MLRVIFDTNIYSFLVKDKNVELLTTKILTDKDFLVYGYKPIRDELREVPKHLKLGKLNQRNLVLGLYDGLVKSKNLKDNSEIEKLAKKYFFHCLSLGSKISWTNVEVDFKMVSCASLNNLDIVVSEDNKMLKNKKALESFRTINDKESLRTPDFWDYHRLIRKYL